MDIGRHIFFSFTAATIFSTPKYCFRLLFFLTSCICYNFWGRLKARCSKRLGTRLQFWFHLKILRFYKILSITFGDHFQACPFANFLPFFILFPSFSLYIRMTVLQKKEKNNRMSYNDRSLGFNAVLSLLAHIIQMKLAMFVFSYWTSEIVWWKVFFFHHIGSYFLQIFSFIYVLLE